MAKIVIAYEHASLVHYMFKCPACREAHTFVESDEAWSWNHDFKNPTINPSIKVEGVAPLTDEEYIIVLGGTLVHERSRVCHSFVHQGNISYLNDCTHSMAGKTLELPEVV